MLSGRRVGGVVSMVKELTERLSLRVAVIGHTEILQLS